MTAERRTLAGMAAWNAAGWVAGAVYGFVLTRLIVRSAGDPAYGIWATVAAVRGFVLCLDGGIAFGVNRDAALEPSRDAAAASRIAAAVRLSVALGAAALAAFALLAGLPGLLLGLVGDDVAAARGVTVLVGAETAAALVATPLPAILRGRRRFEALAVALAAQALLGSALAAALAPRLGLVGIAWAVLGARAAVFAALAVWMRRRGLLPRAEAGADRVAPRRAVVAFALPLWLAAAGARIGAGTDVPIVGGLYGAETAGRYGLGTALPLAAAGLLFAVMDASFPRMVVADAEERSRLVRAQLFMATFLAALGFGLLAVEEGNFLRLWIGRAPDLAVDVAAIACVNWALNAPVHVLIGVAIADGRHRAVGPIVFGEAFFNVALSYALARWWSPLGPAVGTVVTTIITNAIVVPVLLRRRLELTWSAIVKPSIAGWAVGAAGAAVVAAVLRLAAGDDPLLRVAIGCAITLAVAGVVLDLTVRRESRIRGVLDGLRGR